MNYYQPRHASPRPGVRPEPGQSAERIAFCEQALADVYTRLQSPDADPVAIAAAVAAARDCVAKIKVLSTETHRDLALAQYERDMAHSRKAGRDWYPDPGVRPVIPDMPGDSRRPDPRAARTAAEYVDCLRRYRIWAGQPSFRVMERRCDRRFAASTLCTALKGDKMPSQEMALAIITACGGPEEHLREFTSAWRRLVIPAQEASR